jgi:hypothetical protein
MAGQEISAYLFGGHLHLGYEAGSKQCQLKVNSRTGDRLLADVGRMAVQIVALPPASKANIVVNEAAPAAVEVLVVGHDCGCETSVCLGYQPPLNRVAAMLQARTLDFKPGRARWVEVIVGVDSKGATKARGLIGQGAPPTNSIASCPCTLLRHSFDV